MKKFIPAFLVAMTLSGPILPQPVFAHGGEVEVSGGARGPVQLSAAQQAAIALKTAKAETHPLAALLNINGEAALLPDRQADITARISGQVLELYVNLGDSVRAGQRLALVQGRLIGNVSVTISAPINGIVDARDAVVGQAVEPGTRLFHVSDRSQMIIVGKVYEESLGQVKLGQEANIHLLAYPDLALNGKVTLIEPNLDPLSRTVKIWIQTDNTQNLLKPDMFAHIGIILRKNDSALAIPNSAIIEANGEKFVFVREGDKFNRVEVAIGAADDEYSEITDGLVPGDEVATQGNRQIYTMWLTGGQMKSEDD
jgi:multidrug efflux pump subunit AcrA (membrane-fusion protein)